MGASLQTNLSVRRARVAASLVFPSPIGAINLSQCDLFCCQGDAIDHLAFVFVSDRRLTRRNSLLDFRCRTAGRRGVTFWIPYRHPSTIFTLPRSVFIRCNDKSSRYSKQHYKNNELISMTMSRGIHHEFLRVNELKMGDVCERDGDPNDGQ